MGIAATESRAAFIGVDSFFVSTFLGVFGFADLACFLALDLVCISVLLSSP